MYQVYRATKDNSYLKKSKEKGRKSSDPDHRISTTVWTGRRKEEKQFTRLLCPFSINTPSYTDRAIATNNLYIYLDGSEFNSSRPLDCAGGGVEN